MTTEALINALVSDLAGPTRRGPALARLAFAALLGATVCGAAFWVTLGPRPDIWAALATWRFDFKLVWSLSLAASAGFAALRLTNPSAKAGPVAAVLLVPLLVLAAGVATELASVAPADWSRRAVGTNALVCLTAIPLLTLLPLVALMPALRFGASPTPVLSGALTGILAGAIAAAFYALQCIDDSPLFVALWYLPAISVGTLVGALVGRRALHW